MCFIKGRLFSSCYCSDSWFVSLLHPWYRKDPPPILSFQLVPPLGFQQSAMGLFSRAAHNEASGFAQDDAPSFRRVQWTKEPGLRKLYFYAFILCVASATTGYDGMFFNSVQNFESWKDFFGNPEGSMLGLLGALYQIGSLFSIPLV